jgi:SHS family sialic acid transporter-like MFS transporter
MTPGPASTAERPTSGNFAALAAAFLGWLFDGLEMGMFPLVARPALLQMQQATGAASDPNFVGNWMGVVTAAYLVGAAAGGIVFGWLGDRIGRVRAISLSILCYSLCTGATFFVQTPAQLTLARFCAALGMGGEWALGVALVMEVWPSGYRPLLAGLIGAAGNMGFVLIGVIGLEFEVSSASWRWITLIGAAPAFLTLLIMRFVPESHRWEVASDRAKAGSVRVLWTADFVRHSLLAALFCGIMLVGIWGSVQWLPPWADQLTGGHQPSAKAYTQIVLGLGSVVGCLLSISFGRMARRTSYFLICLTSLVGCSVIFRCVGQYGPQFLALTFVVGVTTGSFFGWAPLYLPELFPTRLRATGQGFAYNAGRAIAAVGALQTSALMRHYNGSLARAAAVITLIYGLGLVLIWFAPETKGRQLPA